MEQTSIASLLLPNGQRPILVGEDNPYGTDPKYALFCSPDNSAGGRLQRLVLGLTRAEYLQSFDRVNLCTGKWSIVEARKRAAELSKSAFSLILLGRKVCDAFAVVFEPFVARTIHIVSDDGDAHDMRIIILPHPSGRCTLWNEPGSYERARAVLRSASVLSSEGA